MKTALYSSVHPIFCSIRFIALHAVFAVFACWICAGESFAQESQPSSLSQEEQELLAFEAELDSKIEETRNFEMEQPGTQDSNHTALLYRRDHHSLDILSHVIKMIEKMGLMPADSVTQIAVRSRVTERLASVDDLIIQRLEES